MSDRDLLLAILLGGCLLLTALAIPLMHRRVKPNGWYGFRVPATLSDERMWYEVNAHFGRRMFVIGIVGAAASLLLYSRHNLTMDEFALTTAGVFIVAFAVAIVQSWRHMRRL